MRADRRPAAAAARRAASMGLLLALAVALNLAENLIPALPMLPPGVKLGLSNLVTIYCLFYLGAGEALCIAVLKSGFVLLTRGITAGALSLAGGVLSLLAMLAARRLLGGRGRYFPVSVTGAVFHNTGQLCVAAALLKSAAVFYYLPVLLAVGVLMGCATAALLRAAMPALQRVAAAPANFEKHSGKDG